MSSLIFKKFTAITIFSIAMGFLEAAVVVYLRTLYYPEGFSFPLKNIPIDIFLVEIGREISTIVMLAFISSIWHLGHLLLCLVEGNFKLASFTIDLGPSFSCSGSLDCSGLGSSYSGFNNDHSGIKNYLSPRKRDIFQNK
jgi:hypothetical protein